ncbi:MAG: hypothetical protein L0226_15085 [Acidobacteria bacterium]|nr:hypothetical protein [Acidobacteriota bacterium]
MTEEELNFYCEKASKAAAAVNDQQAAFDAYAEMIACRIDDEIQCELALSKLASALEVKLNEHRRPR